MFDPQRTLPKKLVGIPFHWRYWRWLRLAILLVVDLLLLAVTYWAAFALRLEDIFIASHGEAFIHTLPVVVSVHLAVFLALGMYRQVWRHANIHSVVLVCKCVVIGTAISAGIIFISDSFTSLPPRSVPILHVILASLFVATEKLSWKLYKTATAYQPTSERKNCLVYGAGQAGELLARHCNIDPKFPYRIIGFIDDDKNKKGRLFQGRKIFGTGKDLERVINSNKVEAVILAMHSAPGKTIRRVVESCQSYNVETLVMPDLNKSMDGNYIQLRPVDVKDLLRRSPKSIKTELVKGFLHDECVLITGAGGSIGSELCKQVLAAGPKTLYIADSCEYNLYKVESELQQISNVTSTIVPLLGNIVDVRFVDRIFQLHMPTIVVNAAAYKHVPIVEKNPIEGIINNVVGTKNVATAAARFGTHSFIQISTDKAVNPTNIMGATKRCCELVLQGMNALHKDRCKFVSVRFGNVLGSSGSVIPRFIEQIKAGGPVTVTHPEVTRYFMLTSEAVGLILQAATQAVGGEIFVLNMGEPVKIYDMARHLIMLAGKIPDHDIEIQVTGLRPGEKLYEELIIEGSEKSTLHDDIFIAKPDQIDPRVVLSEVDQVIDKAIQGDISEAVDALHRIAAGDYPRMAKQVKPGARPLDVPSEMI